MRKLLSANFFSMISSKRFWLSAALFAVMPIAVDVDLYQMQVGDWNPTIDGSLLSFVPVLFLLLPALCGLFINTDYHDGTIRNKLTVGRSRASVYLANFITVFLAGLFLAAVNVLLTWLIGLGIPMEDWREVCGQLLMLVLVFLSLTSLSVLLASLVTNRVALILCVFLSLSLMFSSMIINDLLTNPEMIDDYGGIAFTTLEDGTVTQQITDKDGNVIAPEDIPRVPNPRYVREPLRSILRTYNHIQPGGQMMEVMQGGYPDRTSEGEQIIVPVPYWQTALYALGVTLAATALGLLLFRRKDLK